MNTEELAIVLELRKECLAGATRQWDRSAHTDREALQRTFRHKEAISAIEAKLHKLAENGSERAIRYIQSITDIG